MYLCKYQLYTGRKFLKNLKKLYFGVSKMKMYFSISLLLAVVINVIYFDSLLAFDPNFRPFSPHSSNKFSFGYINMNAHPGKMLNMTGFEVSSVGNVSQCQINCLRSKKTCSSLNIKKEVNPENFTCTLLELDKHKAYPHFVTSSDGTAHYEIYVS